MSFVIIVVIVPITWGGASFGTFPPENFAPLSPWRCRRSFSPSLLSRVSMNVFFINNHFRCNTPPIPQAAGIVGAIPTGENTRLTCGYRLMKVSSFSRPTSTILSFMPDYHGFSPPPPGCVYRWAKAVGVIDVAGELAAGCSEYISNLNQIHSCLHTHRFPARKPLVSDRYCHYLELFRGAACWSGKTSQSNRRAGTQ